MGTINLNDMFEKLKKEYNQEDECMGYFLDSITIKNLIKENKDWLELSLDDIFQLVLELRMYADGDIYRTSNDYIYDLIPADCN